MKSPEVVLDTPLNARLDESYRSGAAIGGTSAGAAVMSGIMIAGDVYDPVSGAVTPAARGRRPMSLPPKLSLKKLRLPHTLVLIYTVVVLTVVATWLIPGGECQRVEKDGRPALIPGS